MTKQPSAIESGRLAKLSKQSKLRLEEQEKKRINSIVKIDKYSFRQKNTKTYDMPKPRTEEAVYAEVLRSYQSRDLERIEFFTEQFNRFYPKSVYSDNAVYLVGQLNLAMGFPSEALRYFEKVIQDYPTANKRVAAIFGKGVAYRKLQLFNYAEKVFRQVKAEYPGSSEFFKVDLEMKLLQVERGA
ncbi:MAG: tetratricopeptide repeat protein [Bdellovibrionales bacterium]|nr:tetratricopeptide repeat protein [Bdellovibrionales bacterium]